MDQKEITPKERIDCSKEFQKKITLYRFFALSNIILLLPLLLFGRRMDETQFFPYLIFYFGVLAVEFSIYLREFRCPNCGRRVRFDLWFNFMAYKYCTYCGAILNAKGVGIPSQEHLNWSQKNIPNKAFTLMYYGLFASGALIIIIWSMIKLIHTLF